MRHMGNEIVEILEDSIVKDDVVCSDQIWKVNGHPFDRCLKSQIVTGFFLITEAMRF